jgi:hypothetical protein
MSPGNRTSDPAAHPLTIDAKKRSSANLVTAAWFRRLHTESDAAPPYSAEFPARLDEISRVTVASWQLQARSTPCCSGTIVALQINMSTTFPVIAATSCPVCGRPVEPAPDSTWVIAWYSCRRCGHEWSARIRNGRPDISVGGEVFVHSLAHNERP